MSDRRSTRWFSIAVMALLTATCADQPTPSPPLTSEDPGSSGNTPTLFFDLPGAVVVGIATDGVADPVAVWVTHEGVEAAGIDLEDGRLTGQTSVDGGIAPFAHPIERPAAMVRRDGSVDIAFIGPVESGGTVHLTRWDRHTADTPVPISGSPRPETNLVHVVADPEGEPLFAWLEDSTLSLGRSEDGQISEAEQVDDLTCDCCNPAPVFVSDGLVVAFRDLEHVGGEAVRDVVAIRAEGAKWSRPVPVADDHWFIDGCPFSGPSALVVEGHLVLAWMDARQSLHPSQDTTTIWVDRSDEAGLDFGDDLAVTDGGIHRWPVMAADESGVIHLVWETQGPEGGLSYATSSDAGASFSPPATLVERDPDLGSPTSPSVIVHQGQLLLSWADRIGGHVAVWQIGGD